jgi:hypothetical protein
MSTAYKDDLIEITDREIIFRHYFFPFGSDKRVSFSDIERIEVRPRSFLGGSWRIWGTGDFRTWFPLDKARPSRDRIFLIYLQRRFRRIGFTVEHSEEVITIFKELGLLHGSIA